VQNRAKAGPLALDTLALLNDEFLFDLHLGGVFGLSEAQLQGQISFLQSQIASLQSGAT
jgi:hypothetical protein